MTDAPKPTLPATPQPFDYETALVACATSDRSALQAVYQLENRRLLGVALCILRERMLAEDGLHDAFMNI